MPYNPEYLLIWDSLFFENADKKRLYSYQSFQGRDRKRQTDELFWRNSNDLGIDLSGMGLTIDNSTGEIQIVFDGTGDNPPIINRWITFTDGVNSVDAADGADTFLFEGLNDATVTVDPVSKKVSIDVTGGGLQNLLQSFVTDNGTYTASSPTDQINILGANGVVTKYVGTDLVITGPFSHRTFRGDSGSYSATSANATFDIRGGTDIETTVSGNQVLIDFTGSAEETLWEEDTTNGYLYPKTLTHNVGIGLDDPEFRLSVEENIQIRRSSTEIAGPDLYFEGFAPIDVTLPATSDNVRQHYINLHSRVPNRFSFGVEDKYAATIRSDLYLIGAQTAINPQGLMTVGLNSEQSGLGMFSVVEDATQYSQGGIMVSLQSDDDRISGYNPAIIYTNSALSVDFTLLKNGRMINNAYGTGSSIVPSGGSPMVAFLGVQSTGAIVQSTSLPGIDSGSDGGATNAFGVKTITHSLGTTPTTVIVSKQFEDGAPIQSQVFGEMVEVLRGSITSTSFQVKITDRLGGPLSSTFRTVYYIVM